MMTVPLILYQIDVEAETRGRGRLRRLAAWTRSRDPGPARFPACRDLRGAGGGHGHDPQFSVRFVLKNRENLESYLKDHAQRMRSKGSELFEGGFTARRRVFVMRESHTQIIG
jgi:hypothetical protein